MTKAARRSTRVLIPLGTVAVLATAVAVSGLVGSRSADAQAEPVGLGTAASFAVLAGTTVTNTGPSLIAGDLGVSPGTAITGFPPGVVVPPGVQHPADQVAADAQLDLVTAYNDAALQPETNNDVGDDLAGLTLAPGVYSNEVPEGSGTLGLTGTVTLDAGGDSDAIWIFQASSTLITGSSSVVALTNGASSCNVYWQIGSSATLGDSSVLKGTVMALTSISVGSSADVRGRLLARNGAVTLQSDTVDAIGCEVADVITPTSTSSSSTSTTEVASTTTEVASTTTEVASTTTEAASTTTEATTSTTTASTTVTTLPESTTTASVAPVTSVVGGGPGPPAPGPTVPELTSPGPTFPGEAVPTTFTPVFGPGLPVTGSRSAAPFVLGALALAIGGALQLSLFVDRRRHRP